MKIDSSFSHSTGLENFSQPTPRRKEAANTKYHPPSICGFVAITVTQYKQKRSSAHKTTCKVDNCTIKIDRRKVLM